MVFSKGVEIFVILGDIQTKRIVHDLLSVFIFSSITVLYDAECKDKMQCQECMFGSQNWNSKMGRCVRNEAM